MLGISVNMTTEELLTLTNQKRKEAGVEPLVLSKELSNAASAKASYMLEKDFWAHVAPDGTTPWYFIKNAGYEYNYAGENLARGFSTAQEVVDAWMESPTHRENLLSQNYKDIGFAVATGNLTGSETVLIVQEFGSKYVAPDANIAQVQVPAITSPPTQVRQVEQATLPRSETVVAAAVNKPLVDSKSASFNLSLFLVGLFVVILVVDAVIIERKKVARVVAHNLDHIIFLSILLMAAIIIGRGLVL